MSVDHLPLRPMPPKKKPLSGIQQHGHVDVNDFFMRDLLQPKCILEMFIRICHFEVHKALREAGLYPFMECHNDYYPTLVKMFYCNLQYGGNKITTQVKHCEISLIRDHLRHLCRLLDGNGSQLIEIIVFLRPLPHQVCLERTFVFVGSKYRMDSFLRTNRFLHHILGKIPLPKTGNPSIVSKEDMKYLWSINKCQAIDRAGAIMKHMHDIKKLKGKSFPHCMLVTTILQHFGMDIDRERKVIVRADGLLSYVV